jgi:hypothetical protein
VLSLREWIFNIKGPGTGLSLILSEEGAHKTHEHPFRDRYNKKLKMTEAVLLELLFREELFDSRLLFFCSRGLSVP